jgi:hypothetical protein
MPDGDEYHEWSISETGSLNPYVNAYGHMRSPWNNNPMQVRVRVKTVRIKCTPNHFSNISP